MALASIRQSTHPQVQKIIDDFAKDFLGYTNKPKAANAGRKTSHIPLKRTLRRFEFRNRRRFPVIMPILFIIAAFFLISYLLRVYLQEKNDEVIRRLISQSEDGDRPRHVLLVIAHPDDEAMFFAPLPLSIVRSQMHSVVLHLLCLSTGNYYRQGETRKKELVESANILGFEPENIHITDHNKLQDGPQLWEAHVAASVITDYINSHEIDVLVTFDEQGVSGHNNHKSIYHAVRQIISDPSYSYLKAYALETTGMLRKYVGLLDLPYSWLRSEYLLVSRQEDVYTAQTAMRAHASQYVWFRRLYIRLSRYMIINTYTAITPLEHSVDLKKNS